MLKTRVCSVCGVEKELSLFPKQRTLCKICHNKKTLHIKQKWKTNNPDKVILDRQNRAEVHKQLARQHYLQNKEYYRELQKQYYQNNKALFNAHGAKYRARRKQATPKWANWDDIIDVYKEAQHMQMHVDHIIPLHHPLVCGLHVWDNLQLLSPEANLRKSNLYAISEERCSPI